MKIRKGIIFFCMIFMTAMMIIGCSEDGNKSVGATTDDTESGETSGQIPEKVDIKGNASIGNDTFFLEFNSYTGGLNKLIDPRDETLLNYVAGTDHYGNRNTDGDKCETTYYLTTSYALLRRIDARRAACRRGQYPRAPS